MPGDFLQKFLFEDLLVKGSLVRLSSSWQEIVHRARPKAVTKYVLGETLCASVLLTSNIRFNGSVSLQIQSGGALRLVVGQCSHDGRLRGIARQSEERSLPFLDQAILSLILEPDHGGTPYQGMVEMDNSGLVPAIERYFSDTEQLQSRFWLAAGDSQCSGLMLQKMPEGRMDPDAWNRVQQLASSLSEKELQSLQPEQLIRLLFHQESVRLYAASDIRFSCSCSTDKVTGMLAALGRNELQSLLCERGRIEVCCEYCGKDYLFDPIDIARLLSGPASPASPIGGIH